MALPINIEDLIHRRVVENARVEYKGDWNPEPILHSICAFANDIDNWGGGYIIIGVEEENGMPKFPVKGMEAASLDRVQKDLLNKCNLIEPRYLPVVEAAVVDGKSLLVLWIPGGEDRPYRCPINVHSGKKTAKAYYIRKMSTTLRANQREEQELFSLTRDIPFDDRTNPHAELADIRSSLLSEFLHSVGSNLYQGSLTRTAADVAADMRLVGGPSEFRKPINVGLMFFNESPDRFFPYTQIEVVDKPDPTGTGMTERVFRGPLDKQLRDALGFIRNYVIKEYITKVPMQAEAIRVFNWPYQAIEEALCNAVYHRSYQIHEPVTVMITPEQIEITSIPGPDRSITDEDIEHLTLVSKRYRNRRIGDFLKELKMVEGRNTGVPLMIRAMEENGSNPPFFKTDKERSYFSVLLPIHPTFLERSASATSSVENRPKRKTREALKLLVIDALKRNGNLSTGELAIKLGYKKRTDTLRKVVQELQASGDVSYLYPDKPNSKNQKICLSRGN